MPRIAGQFGLLRIDSRDGSESAWADMTTTYSLWSRFFATCVALPSNKKITGRLPASRTRCADGTRFSVRDKPLLGFQARVLFSMGGPRRTRRGCSAENFLPGPRAPSGAPDRRRANRKVRHRSPTPPDGLVVRCAAAGPAVRPGGPVFCSGDSRHLGVFRRDLGDGGTGVPSAHALEHKVCMLDGVDVAIMLFDHLNRSSHLLGQEIHVHPLGEPEGGVGMPEAIGGAGDARRA